jgi:hypothetical protein
MLKNVLLNFSWKVPNSKDVIDKNIKRISQSENLCFHIDVVDHCNVFNLNDPCTLTNLESTFSIK